MRLLSKVIKSYQYTPRLPQNPENGEGEFPVITRGASEEQAQKIIENAFQKAKQIIESAQSVSSQQIKEASERIEKEWEESKTQGYNEGYAHGMEQGKKDGLSSGSSEGYREGLNKAEAENRKYIDELTRMIEGVERSKSEILDRFESDLKDLAITIAKSIVKKELEIDGKAMHSIVMNATDAYRNQSWLRIFISGHMADILLKTDQNIAEELQNVSDSVKVVAVNRMDDGGCIIEMPDQVIDAGVDTQLKKIKSTIDKTINNPDIREG